MNEGKKDRRDPIRTVKPRNFVAKNAGATTSGAGAHQDKKKAAKQGYEKHKGKEYAESLEYKLREAFEKDFCPVCGCTPCNCTHVVSENFDAEYNDEAGMADNNLETLERAVKGIDELISAGDNLPEWCQEKIAVAKSMLVAVWDYMRSEEDSVGEGYSIGRGIDRERYQERPGLEGPFATKSGKVVYYDKVEGKYYDPDTDMYIEYDDWQEMSEQGVAEGGEWDEYTGGDPFPDSDDDYEPYGGEHDVDESSGTEYRGFDIRTSRDYKTGEVVYWIYYRGRCTEHGSQTLDGAKKDIDYMIAGGFFNDPDEEARKKQRGVAEAFPNRNAGSTGTSKEDKRIAAALRKKHMPAKKKPAEQALNIGDSVIITGNSAFEGIPGRVIGFKEGKVVVDLAEHGKWRFVPERVKLYSLDNQGVAEGRVPQLSPGGADYSKHTTDQLKAMLRPGVMHRDEQKFKTLIRRELKKREQGVAEGIFDIFKKLPAPGSTVKIAGRPVEITHAGRSSNYIGFAWTDKNGKEHYEETPAEEHDNLRSLAKTIAAEIQYADDDGVDDELDAQIKGRLDRHFGKNKGVAEGWGAERQARELEASNAAWRDMLAQYANDPEMTEYLTMFRISNWSPKKAEAESKRWIENDKPLPSWYVDLKSGKKKEMGYKIGEDQGIDDIVAWKQAVIKAYPRYAGQMKFKGRGTQISAEIPGLDRSFGVFDLETGTGQVLDEGKIYLDKLTNALDEAVKKI